MQLPEIKRLSELYALEQLIAAEEALCNEAETEIEVNGRDAGEQLTHVLAAIDIKNDMAINKSDLRTAIRNYTQRVRNSIS